MKFDLRSIEWKRFRASIALGLVLILVILGITLRRNQADDVKSSIDNTDYYTQGLTHLQNGEFALAIDSFEKQLAHLERIPLHTLDIYFGHLAQAHYEQGRKLHIEDYSKASDHYRLAAAFFEQAAGMTNYSVYRSRALFYQATALLLAEEYAETIDVGRLFLSSEPELAVKAELLPKECIGLMHEILSIANISLSESVDESQRSYYYTLGIEHAKEAITANPEGVIQPYFFLGVDAYNSGEYKLAYEYLDEYLNIMRQISTVEWTTQDHTAIAHASVLLDELLP